MLTLESLTYGLHRWGERALPVTLDDMRRTLALTFDPAVTPDRRAAIVARATKALVSTSEDLALDSSDVLVDQSGNETVLAAGISHEYDLAPSAEGTFAFLLSMSPAYLNGDSVDGPSLLARLRSGDSVLRELASPLAIVVRRTLGAPIEAYTDVCGLSGLYVRRTSFGAAVSNSVTALALLERVSVDHEAVQGFSLVGNFDSARSPYLEVRKLSEGHRAELRDGHLDMQRVIHIHTAAPVSDELAVEQGIDVMRSLVNGAADRHGGTLSVEMSGGLDSRGLVSALSAENRLRSRMFTIGQPTDPDWIIADDIAHTIGTEHDFVDLRDIRQIGIDEAWSNVLRSANAHDALTGPVATAVLDWVEAQTEPRPRFNGNNGEYGRPLYGPVAVSGSVTRKRTSIVSRFWVFSNQSVQPALFVPGALDQARSATDERIYQELLSYGSNWRRSLADFYCFGRFQRWAGADFSVSSHHRPILLPFASLPYLEWGRGLSFEQRRDSRIFSRVLQRMEPSLAAMGLAHGSIVDPDRTPASLAYPSSLARLERAKSFAKGARRKIDQRVNAGKEAPPAGALDLASAVAQKWRQEPSLLEPVLTFEWIDVAAIDQIGAGAINPTSASTNLLTNLIVIANVIKQSADMEREFATS